jgi:hypothetical protein
MHFLNIDHSRRENKWLKEGQEEDENIEILYLNSGAPNSTVPSFFYSVKSAHHCVKVLAHKLTVMFLTSRQSVNSLLYLPV